MSKIYLDNGASTRPYEEVLQKSMELNREIYGNPSSVHAMGLETEREIKRTSKIIGDYLDIDSREICYTSGGTEANNIAIQGIVRGYSNEGKHIITTKSEHSSVREVYEYLETTGYKVSYISVNQYGKMDLEELDRTITEDTILVSVIHVNNETGAINDIQEIGRIIKSKNKNIIFHVDGVQSYGKMEICLKNVDIFTGSSHKIHGLKAVGFLYIKTGLKIKPMFYGGLQYNKIRVGSENTIGIVCFGLATKLAIENIESNNRYVKGLRDELLKMAENKNILVNGNPDEDLPYILNLSFINTKAEILLNALSLKKIYVSTGSACSAKKKELKNVLASYGYNSNRVNSAIRFSFSKFNTIEEIIKTKEIIKESLSIITH